MNISFISIPKEIDVLPDWQESVDITDKVDDFAQSIFSKMTDYQLNALTVVSLVGKVASILALGVSVYSLAISGILIFTGSLIICFIGDHAIRRERLCRFQEVCRNFEGWLIDFSDKCEELKNALFQVTADPLDMDHAQDEIQELLQSIKEMPENEANRYADQLKDRHQQVFGQYRKVGNGYWSSYWIDRHLKSRFGEKVSGFFALVCVLQKAIRTYEEDPIDDHKKDLIYCVQPVLKELIEKKQEQPQDPDPSVEENEMFLLTKRSNSERQGQDCFQTLMDYAEYWRVNIAIFRSSLKELA